MSGHPPRKFSSRSRHQQQLLQLHLQGREIKPMASFLHCGNTEFLLQEIHIVEITEIHSNSFFDKNFVKATFLQKKLLNIYFNEFFFSVRIIF